VGISALLGILDAGHNPLLTRDLRMAIPHEHDTPGKGPRTEVSSPKVPPAEVLLKAASSNQTQRQEWIPTEKDQYDEVNSIYNKIKSAIREVNEHSTELQTIKNREIKEIDAFLIANMEKNKMKAESSRLLSLAKAITLNTAPVLTIFRSE
jgi:hypothetical protein